VVKSKIWIIFLLSGLSVLAQDSQKNQTMKLHQSEEKYWSQKEHVSPVKVREMISAVGLDRGEAFNIDNLDTHTLAAKKQVLFSVSESGTGHCLTVYVLQAEGTNYRKIWSADQLDDAYATAKYIFVQMPLNLKGDPDAPSAEIELLCAAFSWDGNTFKLAHTDHKVVPKSEYRIKSNICSQ
jgi:hypothetical protein